MTITPSLFEAFLKCPMKCWLRATNEQPAGNIYAEWVKTQNESYRVAETSRLIAQMPPPGSALSPPAETLKLAKWLLASDVVVRATGISRGSRSEKALSSPSQPGQPGIDAGSGGLGNPTSVPSFALGTPDSTLETSPAHLGAAPQPAESPPTCVLETCLHVVERVPAEGRGKAAQFIPIRCIFFNKLTKDDKLLLAYDAFVLGQVLGRDITVGKLIHGDDLATLKVKTSALAGEVRKRLEKVAALLCGPAPPDLVLNRHCAECEFQGRCRKIAVEKDDLSLLGGMSEKERSRHRSKGIFTVTQLSYTFRPRRTSKWTKNPGKPRYLALQALPIRENTVYFHGAPTIPQSRTQVFLDIEGLPDRDFYYMAGALVVSDGDETFHSFWADTESDEPSIFAQLLETITQLGDFRVFHFGDYETVALKRMRSSLSKIHQQQTDMVLQHCTNVLSVIYPHVYFPTYSNKLKDIGRFLGPEPSTHVAMGLESIIWRRCGPQNRAQR